MTRLAPVALLAAIVPAARAQQATTTGTIVAIVTAAEGAPLPVSIVDIPARGIERLTDQRGEATLATTPLGSVAVRVRHLGYSPSTLTTIVRPGTVDTVRVGLTKLATQLGAVNIRAQRECTKPGRPKPASDAAFAALFDQLEQNADQYRLVSEEYPFFYEMERESSVRYVSGEVAVQHLDTIRVGTGVRWKYAPGDVVERSDDPHNRQVIFNIPALIHFADPTFLANHCFFYGGRDTADGSAAFRIDFLAASRLKAPDVDGSMYLDPTTYEIRRAVLRLTRIPPETPEISSVTVVTDFRTIVPWISIVRSISSVHQLFTDSTRPVLPMTAYETQRLVGVTFLKGKPGGD